MRTIAEIFVSSLILLLGSCALQSSQPLSQVQDGVVAEIAFESSWIEHLGWSLRVLADGSVAAKGDYVGKIQKRIALSVLSDLQATIETLIDSVSPGVYSGGVEDADRICVRIPRQGGVLEFTVDVPVGRICSSDQVQKIGAVWDTVILAVAPDAQCNGLPCVICEGNGNN